MGGRTGGVRGMGELWGTRSFHFHFQLTSKIDHRKDSWNLPTECNRHFPIIGYSGFLLNYNLIVTLFYTIVRNFQRRHFHRFFFFKVYWKEFRFLNVSASIFLKLRHFYSPQEYDITAQFDLTLWFSPPFVFIFQRSLRYSKRGSQKVSAAIVEARAERLEPRCGGLDGCIPEKLHNLPKRLEYCMF